MSGVDDCPASAGLEAHNMHGVDCAACNSGGNLYLGVCSSLHDWGEAELDDAGGETGRDVCTGGAELWEVHLCDVCAVPTSGCNGDCGAHGNALIGSSRYFCGLGINGVSI
jgi:hypothetical protein